MSRTRTASSSTTTVIAGATPAVSQASSPLSTSSLSSASSHRCCGWPICMVSSVAVKNSSSRLVVKVSRRRVAGSSDGCRYPPAVALSAPPPRAALRSRCQRLIARLSCGRAGTQEGRDRRRVALDALSAGAALRRPCPRQLRLREGHGRGGASVRPRPRVQAGALRGGASCAEAPSERCPNAIAATMQRQRDVPSCNRPGVEGGRE